MDNLKVGDDVRVIFKRHVGSIIEAEMLDYKGCECNVIIKNWNYSTRCERWLNDCARHLNGTTGLAKILRRNRNYFDLIID